MDRTRKLWVIVGLACLSFGVCMSKLTSTSASGLRSSSVKPIPASLGQPRMTLHASSRSSELRYADAADLQSDQVENEGGTPTDLLQVDVNNDGMADLVAAYQTAEGPRVRVRLGSSSGELGQPQSYPVHSSLVKAAAFGDFNGDGFRDLIVTSGEEGTAQFLFGRHALDLRFFKRPVFDAKGLLLRERHVILVADESRRIRGGLGLRQFRRLPTAACLASVSWRRSAWCSSTARRILFASRLGRMT